MSLVDSNPDTWSNQILLISSDLEQRQQVAAELSMHGFCTTDVLGYADARAVIEEKDFAILICDGHLADGSGIELLTEFAIKCPKPSRMLLAGSDDVPGLIDAINKRQVHAVLHTPIQSASLLAVARQCSAEFALCVENNRLRDHINKWQSMLESALQARNDEIAQSREDMIGALVRALDAREHAAAGHSLRVTAYTMRIALEYGVDSDVYVDLYYGALLHDIGKIGIQDSILLKRGLLTDEERELMNSHVKIAQEILGKVTGLGEAHLIPRYHHEKYDGTGYSEGLKGDDIPLQARIFAIADVYDALLTERPYKKAMPNDKAVEIIRADAGTHFDPRVVEAFLNIPETDFLALSERVNDHMTMDSLLVTLAKDQLAAT